jgi:beta-glucosidase
LSFSWPKRANQFVLNVGDKDYDPLFAYGYGLSYARPRRVAPLPETSGLEAQSSQSQGTWFEKGKLGAGMQLALTSRANVQKVQSGTAVTDGLKSLSVDRRAQEDSRRFVWTGQTLATWIIRSETAVDLSRESNGALAIEIDLMLDSHDGSSLFLGQGCGDTCEGQIDLGPEFKALTGKGWSTLSIPLSCLAHQGVDMSKLSDLLRMTTHGPTDLTISRVALGSSGVGRIKCQ